MGVQGGLAPPRRARGEEPDGDVVSAGGERAAPAAIVVRPARGERVAERDGRDGRERGERAGVDERISLHVAPRRHLGREDQRPHARAPERVADRRGHPSDGDHHPSARVLDQIGEVGGRRLGVAHRHHRAVVQRREERPGEGRRVVQDDEDPLLATEPGRGEEALQRARPLGRLGVAVPAVAEEDRRPIAEALGEPIEEVIVREVEVVGEGRRRRHGALDYHDRRPARTTVGARAAPITRSLVPAREGSGVMFIDASERHRRSAPTGHPPLAAPWGLLCWVPLTRAAWAGHTRLAAGVGSNETRPQTSQTQRF